jgi:response regulator RpfG family c-di-GMP phosphodiesterase
MKVIYADNDIQMIDYASMLLEAALDCNVLEANSENEILSILSFEPEVDFVISDISFFNDSKLLNYLDNNNIDIPIILLSESDSSQSNILLRNSLNTFIPKPFSDVDFFPVVENLIIQLKSGPEDSNGITSAEIPILEKKENDIEVVTEKTKLNDNDINYEVEQDYIKRKVECEEDFDKFNYKRISLKRLINFTTASADIYIKIGKSKYIKIINKSENYSLDLINKYKEKNVHFFFIVHNDYKYFLNQFSELVFDKLRKAQELPVDVKIIAELSAYDSILERAIEIGITKRVADQVEDTITSISKTIDMLPNLSEFLKKIMRGDNYLSEHSLLLSFIVGQILQETPWSSPSTLNKLTMAALFHDCSLESDLLAKFDSLEEAKKFGLNKKDLELITEHPARSADLINSGENIFPDVDTIIAQHHEKPDQSGFPRGIGSLNIAPLSCLFILASNFCDILINKPGVLSKESLEDIKNEFSQKYDKGNFKKSLNAFLKVF